MNPRWLFVFMSLAASSWPAVAAGATYSEDFAVDGSAPSEYGPVGGASLGVAGGQLIVTASGGGGQQGFQLTYPSMVGGEPLEVFCTDFEVDLPALLPSINDELVVTFFESPASIETTVRCNGDGTYFLRLRKNGADVFVQANAVLPEGFARYRWDRDGNTVTLEKVRADGTWEKVFEVDPPPGVPFSSVIFTTNTAGFAIDSILAGPHRGGIAVPAVSGIGLMLTTLLFLVVGAVIFRKRPRRAVATAGLVLCLCVPSFAQTETTAKTDPIDLGTVEAGTGVAGVSVTKTLKLNGCTGQATVGCKFSNTNAAAKTFAFCHMIALKAAVGGMVATAKCCNFQRSPAPNANNIECNPVACVPPNAPAMIKPGYHFGCIVVTVPGGTVASPGMFTPPDSGSPAIPAFVGRDADDIDVSYADVINMTGLTLDNAGTCAANGCFGLNTYTNLVGALAPIAGAWVAHPAPFKDPFIRYEATAIEYAAFDDMPCLPSSFPDTVTCPQMPTCPSQGPLPDVITKDINLFDFRTMATTDPTSVFLTVQTEQALPPGVVIETDPPPFVDFDIPGLEEFHGTLTVTSPPDLAEGTKLNVLILVHDAQTGEPRFPQHNVFIHDTVPPSPGTPLTFVDAENHLNAQVTVADATTEPLNAILWYSTDEGITWTFESLESPTSLFQDAPVRTFAGRVGPFPDQSTVQYFFTTQDRVYNVTYFGLDEILITPGSGIPTMSNWGSIVLLLLFLTGGTIHYRSRQDRQPVPVT